MDGERDAVVEVKAVDVGEHPCALAAPLRLALEFQVRARVEKPRWRAFYALDVATRAGVEQHVYPLLEVSSSVCVCVCVCVCVR
jgi:hypothetical protein